MKSIAVIFLIVVYTFTATEAKQLLKFPVMLEHYAEHKKHDATISFFDFIYMHYAGSDFDDTDQDRDMKLPFKSSSFANYNITVFYPTSIALVLKPVVFTKNKTAFYTEENFQSSYLSSIWQPPRIC